MVLFKVEDTSCIWRATEWSLDEPVARTLKVQFSSTQAAKEMYYNFEECMQYAQQFEIQDHFPEENF